MIAPTKTKLSKVELPEGVLAASVFLIPCLLCIPRRGPGEILVVAIAAAAALWVGYHQPIAERYLRRHPGKRWTFLILASALLSVMTIGDLLSARWWVIDDHELALILGDDQTISGSEALQALAAHPEVGHIGSHTRVRPIYYVLRYAEAWLWGDNLFLWYSARIAALTGVFVLMWHLLWRWLGGIDAGLMLLFVFCWRMWSDIWARIGPSETYAMVGIAVAIAGVVWLERGNRLNRLAEATAWSGVAIGSIVAIGVKENFLILVPTALAYLGLLAYRRRMSATSVVGVSAIVASGMFIAYSVLTGLKSTDGLDVYSNPRSLTTMTVSAVESVTANAGAVIVLAILALLVFFQRSKNDKRLSPMRDEIVTSTIVLVALLALFVSQYVFYDDFAIISNRYAFPAVFSLLFMIPILTRLRLRYRKLVGVERALIRRSQTHLRLATVLVIVVAGISMQRNATRHVENTNRFTDELLKVVQVSRQQPDTPLIFFSHKAVDYEQLHSVARFLRFYQVTNPIYLNVDQLTDHPSTSVTENALADELRDLSRHGGKSFNPIGELTLTGESVIGIAFSGEVSEVACVAEFPCWK